MQAFEHLPLGVRLENIENSTVRPSYFHCSFTGAIFIAAFHANFIAALRAASFVPKSTVSASWLKREALRLFQQDYFLRLAMEIG